MSYKKFTVLLTDGTKDVWEDEVGKKEYICKSADATLAVMRKVMPDEMTPEERRPDLLAEALGMGSGPQSKACAVRYYAPGTWTRVDFE